MKGAALSEIQPVLSGVPIAGASGELAAGFGLRLNLGFALARLAMGFKLARREDEYAFRLHFSLGQAF